MKIKMMKGIKFQFTMLFVFFTLILSIGVGFCTYLVNYSQVYNQYLELGKNSAEMAVSGINIEHLSSFLKKGKNNEYFKTKNFIDQIVKSYDLTSIYVFVPNLKKNSITYILDSLSEGTDPDLISDLGDEIDGIDLYDQLLKMFQNKNCESSFNISKNEYGYLASTYMPIMMENGETVALMGLDMPMSDILYTVNTRTLIMTLATIICVIIFATILLIIIDKNIVNPIKMMSGKMNDFIKQGKDLDSDPIKLHREDELKLMADSFNKMVLNLSYYIENLTKVTSEREKIHSELNVAKNIQKSLLPCIFPRYSNRKDIDIFAFMYPAKEVGGDFYDFFFIDQDHLVLLVADVSGKGVAAALFMVIAKTLIKNELQSNKSIDLALTNVNNQLCESNTEDMFVTSFISVFNLKTGELSYLNAGHNRPLIYRTDKDKFDWLDMEVDFVLASLDEVKYKIQKTYLKKGDVLYAYTDGVTEALNNDSQLFSDERLIECLNNMDIKNLSVEEIAQKVNDQIKNFANGMEQADDITMLVFRNKQIDYIKERDD